MFNHIRNVFRALRVLWGLTAITPTNRYLLWRKTLRLYASLLAFTDTNRPTNQLRRAMICAILTSVYDYDTDWVKTPDPENSLFMSLLNKLLQSHPHKEQVSQLAKDLFLLDWQNKLSSDGLERGSISLQFYNLVIGSEWMSVYSANDICSFGRQLQIVDDMLDLESDRQAGQTNCLLTDKKETFIRELNEFLDCDFFKRLMNNSAIYRKLKADCQDAPRLWKGLFQASHFHTGLYAALITVIGFRFYSPISNVAIAFAATFALITWNIMSFNDWIDRFHDRKKDKMFASEHPRQLLRFWLALSTLALLFLITLSHLDPIPAVFVGAVWFLGLLYSYAGILRWYLANNTVVAICSASPVLLGSILHRSFSYKPCLIFGALFCIILSREIYMDIRDIKIDKGYKATIPVIKGYVFAPFYLIGILYGWAVCLVLYPDPWVKGMACTAAAVQFAHSRMFLSPKQYKTAKWMLDWVIRLLLITLLITQ